MAGSEQRFFSTTQASPLLTELVERVQDPRDYVVLTRHGRAVAALVSMEELERIWDWQRAGRGALSVPKGFVVAPDGQLMSERDAAEAVRKVQMDRKAERDALARAGLRPVAGGELSAETEVRVPLWQRIIAFWR